MRRARFVSARPEHSYDKLSRVVRTSLPRAGSGETATFVHHSYDANGRLNWTSLPTDKSASGEVAVADKTVNEYWDTGAIYSTAVGGAAKVRYDYTAEGWQALRLPETAEGTGVAAYEQLMYWDYFPDGLLQSERDLSGRRSTYTYDANGNRTSAAEAQSILGDVLTINSSFDGFDQLSKVRTPRSGGNYWASLWTYDQHGNVATLIENQEEDGAGAVVAGGAGRGFGYEYTNADEPLHQTDDFSTPGAGDDERFSFS